MLDLCHVKTSVMLKPLTFFTKCSLWDVWHGSEYISDAIGVFLVRIFLHSDWIWRDMEYLSVFSPNAGKYGPEKLRMQTLFTLSRLGKWHVLDFHHVYSYVFEHSKRIWTYLNTQKFISESPCNYSVVI